MQGVPNARPGAGGDFAAFEVAGEFFPFGVGGGAVFLTGPLGAAAGEEAQVDGFVGVDGFVAEGDLDVAVPGDDLGDVRREPCRFPAIMSNRTPSTWGVPVRKQYCLVAFRMIVSNGPVGATSENGCREGQVRIVTNYPPDPCDHLQRRSPRSVTDSSEPERALPHLHVPGSSVLPSWGLPNGPFWSVGRVLRRSGRAALQTGLRNADALIYVPPDSTVRAAFCLSFCWPAVHARTAGREIVRCGGSHRGARAIRELMAGSAIIMGRCSEWWSSAGAVLVNQPWPGGLAK